MKRHNTYRVRQKAVHSSPQRLPWRFFVLTVLCACIMAAGFFFAARQHFTTMDFGLKNSKLRKQIEDLESERRRLILAKEVSLSPTEIARTAERLGFRTGSDVPRPTVISLPQKDQPSTEIRPVTASLKETAVNTKVEPKKTDPKGLVKQIVQQNSVKPAGENQRPRIVGEQDKRVAVTTNKALNPR